MVHLLLNTNLVLNTSQDIMSKSRATLIIQTGAFFNIKLGRFIGEPVVC
jgi:hypothetical protein